MINRIALALLCLALIGGSIAVIALAWALPQESIDWLGDAAVWLDDHNTDGTKALITLGAAILAVVALIALAVELVPRDRGEVKVTGLQVGDAVLTTAAIGQRIEEAVNEVPNVSDVRATVRTKRQGVTVALDLHVDPDANLAAVTDAACEAARDVLIEKVHVELMAPPRARLHYRELRLKGRSTPSGGMMPPSAPDAPAAAGAPVVSEAPQASESMMESRSAVAVADEESPVQA
jgi:hypothetical protein